MTDPLSVTPVEVYEPLPWYQLWLKAWRKLPTAEHLATLERHYPLLTAAPKRARNRAYLWLVTTYFVAYLIVSSIRLLLYSEQFSIPSQEISDLGIATIIIGITLACAIQAVGSSVTYILYFTLLHWFAKAVRRNGSYDRFVFLLTLYLAPLILLLGMLQALIPPTSRASSVIGLFLTYLYLRVYQAVYRLGTGTGCLLVIGAAAAILVLAILLGLLSPQLATILVPEVEPVLQILVQQ